MFLIGGGRDPEGVRAAHAPFPGVLLLVAAALAVSGAAPARATPFCRHPISRAVWSDEAQGSRLMVFPTGCGRRTSFLDPRSAFADAVAAGRRRPPHRRSLFLQFRCHAYFAPVKRSWNLEAWRPVVSQRRLIKALCNPAGHVPNSFARRRSMHGLVALLTARIRRAARVAGDIRRPTGTSSAAA